MAQSMKSPGPLGGTGARGLVIAGELDGSKDTLTPLCLQVAALSRRYLLAPTTAALLASMVYGEAARG
jgi:hypothetical protein